MKKIMLEKIAVLGIGGVLFASALALPVPAVAEVHINIGIPVPHITVSLPSPPIIRFQEPPRLVALPQTYVYAAPDIEEEIFFYDGWWWRPWEGRWYRSRHYNSGWNHYKKVPSFSRKIPHDWRNDYREHRWRGHQWETEQMSHRHVEKNWKNWKNTKHWDKRKNWSVDEPRVSQPVSAERHSPRPQQQGRPERSPQQGYEQENPRLPVRNGEVPRER